jgi:hypothetical protein
MATPTTPCGQHLLVYPLLQQQQRRNKSATDSVAPRLLRSPTELLTLLNSASVNPLDMAMAKGYGSTTVSLLRSQGLVDLRHGIREKNC